MLCPGHRMPLSNKSHECGVCKGTGKITGCTHGFSKEHNYCDHNYGGIKHDN